MAWRAPVAGMVDRGAWLMANPGAASHLVHNLMGSRAGHRSDRDCNLTGARAGVRAWGSRRECVCRGAEPRAHRDRLTPGIRVRVYRAVVCVERWPGFDRDGQRVSPATQGPKTLQHDVM